MSEQYSNNTSRPRLVNYYTDYAPSRFFHKDGRPVGKRQQQLNARKYRLPVAYIGNNAFVDPDAADQQLLKFVRYQPRPEGEKRGRGRPRITLD
jgi:hypothetical protein